MVLVCLLCELVVFEFGFGYLIKRNWREFLFEFPLIEYDMY